MIGTNETQGFVPLTSSVVHEVHASAARQVLICEPQLCSYGLPFLPAMYGVLKTYWETHATQPEMIHWHKPIYKMDPPEQVVESLRGVQIDVLGLSCYTWNWRLQQEIARLVKQTHPDCLIVAGGPHPDYRNPAFFTENPFIDAVVVKAGEVPFNRILQRVLSFAEMKDFHDAGGPLDDIPGLSLPGRGGKLTAPSESPIDFDTSAYLAQRDYYEEFMREHPEGVVAAWETCRGCPFRCSYCDWGSSTMSKVRRFDMGRINAEIDWFARSGICVVFSVDSNFGMFKTDVGITDQIVLAKEKHGHPQYFIYSNAKNVPDRTVEITRKVVQAGLDTAHTLSIQHSSIDVLEATERENISIEKQIKVVRELQADGIPISVQLILGLPKDTPQLWRKTFTDLMEWGIHDGYIITNYHLLPNAPAADPVYRAKWEIEGVERYIYDGPGSRVDEPVDQLTYPVGEVIVATSSFTRDDWVVMSAEASIIRALHNGGLTQSIARYLRSTHGIGYDEFYSNLIEEFLPKCKLTSGLVDTLHGCYSRFLHDESFLSLLPMPGVEGTNEHVEPHRWMLASLCLNFDEFSRSLVEFLCAQYPEIEHMESVCSYQFAIVVHPKYNPSVGASWPVEHDWVSYFNSPDTRFSISQRVPEPKATPNASLQISDTSWDDGTGRGDYQWIVAGEPQWDQWFHSIASNRLSETKCNYQSLQVEFTKSQKLNSIDRIVMKKLV